MGRLGILVILLGVVSYSHGGISGSVVDVTVQPGDNITLYCDCKLSTGVYVVWYRNCSHENQPPLVLKMIPGKYWKSINDKKYDLRILPHFQLVKNSSSGSYDLLITNITALDEGLYYCGTEETKVEERDFITPISSYEYGNVTKRITVNSSPGASEHVSNPLCAVSWMTVFTPAITILSSVLCFILVYHFFQRADEEPQILQKRPDSRRLTGWNQDEDVYLSRVVFQAKHA